MIDTRRSLRAVSVLRAVRATSMIPTLPFDENRTAYMPNGVYAIQEVTQKTKGTGPLYSAFFLSHRSDRTKLGEGDSIPALELTCAQHSFVSQCIAFDNYADVLDQYQRIGTFVEKPKPGTVWMHKKGSHYVVICCAEDTVFYQAIDTERKLWHRPVAEFLDGRFEYQDSFALTGPGETLASFLGASRG